MTRKKHGFIYILILILIIIVVFILTPLENPLKKDNQKERSAAIKDEYSFELCLPENDGSYIYHNNYYLSYSEEHEQALWVASMLTADKILQPTVDRNNFSFIPDPDIITGSAVTSDYTNSGYDRGHLLSFASNGWNEEAGHDSFYMSNMSPQKPKTNRNTYERLEEAERSAVAQNGVLYVVHGPVLTDPPYERIGKNNQISVPNYYFVCFLDYTGETKKAIGFIIPNDDISYSDITQFAKSIDEVEKISGLNFFYRLPDEEEELLESAFNVNDWDLSTFSRSKLAEKYNYDLNNLKLNIETSSPNFEENTDIMLQFYYFLYTNFSPIKKQILMLFNNLSFSKK